MVGRSEDGSGSVKVRISQGIKSSLQIFWLGLVLSSEIGGRRLEAGGWGWDLFRGFVSPRLILTFTLPDPSSLLPTMLDPFSFPPSLTHRIYPHSHSPKHIGSILTHTLTSTSDPSSLPPSRAHRIHPDSHRHELAGCVRYAAWKVSFFHSGGKANNLIQDRINGSGNSTAGYTRLVSMVTFPQWILITINLFQKQIA